MSRSPSSRPHPGIRERSSSSVEAITSPFQTSILMDGLSGSLGAPHRSHPAAGLFVVMVPVVVGEVPVSGVGDFGDGGACGLLVDDGLAVDVGGDEGLEGEVVDGAGVAAGGGVNECGGVVAEQGVCPAGEFEVVADVAGG